MIDRLRQWCARPYLEDMRKQHEAVIEALTAQFAASINQSAQRYYEQGYAEGQARGRNEAASAVQSWIEERQDTGPAQDDLARLRRMH